MFDFEWTGRSAGDETDRKRGIAAALVHCAEQGYDPERLWQDMTFDLDAAGHWRRIETRAIAHLCKGWKRTPDNVSLIWIPEGQRP